MAEAIAGTYHEYQSNPPICVKRVIVENDCAAVINPLKNRNPDKSIIADLVREMLELMSLVLDLSFIKCAVPPIL
jgi:hypothetical protein